MFTYQCVYIANILVFSARQACLFVYTPVGVYSWKKEVKEISKNGGKKRKEGRNLFPAATVLWQMNVSTKTHCDTSSNFWCKNHSTLITKMITKVIVAVIINIIPFLDIIIIGGSGEGSSRSCKCKRTVAMDTYIHKGCLNLMNPLLLDVSCRTWWQWVKSLCKQKDCVPLRRHWLHTQCHAPPSWPAACPETQTSTNEQGVWLITSGSQSPFLPFSRVWLCACPAPLQTFPPDPTLLCLWFPIKSRRLLWFLPLIFCVIILLRVNDIYLRS